jgi:hypothetical protein
MNGDRNLGDMLMRGAPNPIVAHIRKLGACLESSSAQRDSSEDQKPGLEIIP